jgi:hypothetical protein
VPEQNLRTPVFQTPYANQFSSSLVQALAPRTVRGFENLSHVRKTLKPGVPVIPLRQTSFEVVGQWPVCRAVASPTEEPYYNRRLQSTPIAGYPWPFAYVNRISVLK